MISVFLYLCFHSLHICPKTSGCVCVSMHMHACIHVCVTVVLHILLPVSVVARAIKV